MGQGIFGNAYWGENMGLIGSTEGGTVHGELGMGQANSGTKDIFLLNSSSVAQ